MTVHFQWYVARDGQQIGPITHEELLAFVEAGHLKSSDQVWRAGFADWKNVDAVPGLFTPPVRHLTQAIPSIDLTHSEPPPSRQAQQPRAKAVSHGGDPTLVGVAGWLLFFCVSLTVFSPLIMIGTLVPTLNETREFRRSVPGFETYYQTLLGLTFLMVVASIYVGVTLWRRQPKAHIFARNFLLYQFAIASVAPFLIFAYVNVPSENVGTVMADAIPDILRAGVYTGVWHLYLKYSKRVRATFG